MADRSSTIYRKQLLKGSRPGFFHWKNEFRNRQAFNFAGKGQAKSYGLSMAVLRGPSLGWRR